MALLPAGTSPPRQASLPRRPPIGHSACWYEHRLEVRAANRRVPLGVRPRGTGNRTGGRTAGGTLDSARTDVPGRSIVHRGCPQPVDDPAGLTLVLPPTYRVQA